MQYDSQETVLRDSGSILATNKVLRNTYSLLAITLLFGGFMAYISMIYHFPHPGFFVFVGVTMGLMYVTHALRNSAWALVSTFALTGFLGSTLGMTLEFGLSGMRGSEVVMHAFVGTGIIFFAISAYAIKTDKDFKFLSGFVIAGFITALLAMIANHFLKIEALSIGVSALFLIVSSTYILYETNKIVRGGETNYIIAAVGLYVSLYNIFVTLTHLLGVFGDD